MPHAIQQPYIADIREETEHAERAAKAEARAAAPAMGITRIDLPFWDVFCFALKFFIAQAIISAPFVVVIWLALR